MRLALLLAGIAILGAAATWAWVEIQRRRQKTPEEVERLRRSDLCQRGRIASGAILDLMDSPEHGSGQLVIYKYNVAGVTYEAAQDVSSLPGMTERARSLLGEVASVKYDPRRATNSIIACEDWCGLGDGPGPAGLSGQPVKQESQ